MKKACIEVGEKVWTLTYVINKDQTLTIQNFDSADNDGYMFAESFPKLEHVHEVEGRVVDKVTIDGVTRDVANKQNVFTYKQPL